MTTETNELSIIAQYSDRGDQYQHIEEAISLFIEHTGSLKGFDTQYRYLGKFDSLKEFLQEEYMNIYFSDVQKWIWPFNDERVIDWGYIEDCYNLNDAHNYLELNGHYFICQ